MIAQGNEGQYPADRKRCGCKITCYHKTKTQRILSEFRTFWYFLNFIIEQCTITDMTPL